MLNVQFDIVKCYIYNKYIIYNIKIMASQFKHYDLEIIKPDFDSPLTSTILELEKLRNKVLGGSTPVAIFFQLKNIFHFLESLGSARIEGNNTTLSELVERKIEEKKEHDKEENFIEIDNMEKAMGFIEEVTTQNTIINKAYILELQKIIVKDLKTEGDLRAGNFRGHEVAINKSGHKPPTFLKVEDYMDELVEFINKKVNNQFELLITAITHHRFAWIHPFGNGNGRTVRALTYAMLIKQGFNVKSGRILNPTAIFCNDREKYYNMLAEGDKGTREGMLTWCDYVLNGLLREINKVDKLSDIVYLTNEILVPAFDFSLERQYINKSEHDILKLIIKKPDMIISSADLESLYPNKVASERSRIITRFKNKKMLLPLSEKGRKYTIGFNNSYLLRGIIEMLKTKGFASD